MSDIIKITVVKRKKHYLNNKDLVREILLSKENKKLTDDALKMLMLLTKRVIGRLPYSEQYLKEEATANAHLDILLYWDRFDENKSDNAFSFYTQMIKNGAAKGFNIAYQFGKNFKGRVISLDGSRSNDSENEIYSI